MLMFTYAAFEYNSKPKHVATWNRYYVVYIRTQICIRTERTQVVIKHRKTLGFEQCSFNSYIPYFLFIF